MMSLDDSDQRTCLTILCTITSSFYVKLVAPYRSHIATGAFVMGTITCE